MPYTFFNTGVSLWMRQSLEKVQVNKPPEGPPSSDSYFQWELHPHNDGYYWIENHRANGVVRSDNGMDDDGTPITLGNDKPDQNTYLWRFVPTGAENSYTIQLKSRGDDGLYLNAPYGDEGSGLNLHTLGHHNEWKLEAVS
ncbi:hypothetical protein GCM10022245_29220 [Streptomyces mayteni]